MVRKGEAGSFGGEVRCSVSDRPDRRAAACTRDTEAGLLRHFFGEERVTAGEYKRVIS